MKSMLALVVVLTLTAPALAESRSVMVVVNHDKDGKTKVTIYSEQQLDRRDAVTVDDAGKVIAGMKGSGSAVNVYVVIDKTLAKKDRKALFDAIDANAVLDLAYYGSETPKALAERFLKRIHAPEVGGADSDAVVEKAGKRGAATAAADIKDGRAVILYYGPPWSTGKPLVDDATGLKIEVIGGCIVTRAFAAEVEAYNAAVREWHTKKK